MAKLTVTHYKCDLCKKESTDSNFLKQMSMPCLVSDCEGKNYSRDISRFDVCPCCRKRYIDVMFNNFGIIYDTLSKVDFHAK